MVFSSILFLCLFLPAVTGLYFLLPRFLRNPLLFAASLLFYAWGEPVYIFIMLFSTVFDYANGLMLERFAGNDTRPARPALRKAVLVLSVCVNLGLLCFFKYTDFALGTIHSLTGSGPALLGLALPIGISFYTFQTLSYTIDVYRGNVKAQHNILDFGMYVCMFPQLIAGPIVRYTDIADQIRGRRETAEDFYRGLQRFLIGLAKKVILANQIGLLWDEISASGPALPAATAWLGAVAFTFQIYFDFSGYSDMAIGMGRMFGFRFPENFRYPYEAGSVTDFWRRWHMTLGTWFREYLYIPLGGNRLGIPRQVINLLLVWFLTGLWHGAGWNFILWGLYYFALLVLEKFVFRRLLERFPAVLRHIITLVFVVFGWVIFACTEPGMLPAYLGSLFGAHGAGSSMALYYLRTWGPLLAILCIGSTHLPALAAGKVLGALDRRPVLLTVLEFAATAALAVLSIIFLTGDSYNPFLYFRF